METDNFSKLNWRLRAYMNQYGRADVLRILRISAKQLVGWQRAGLAPQSDAFTFIDLVQLRAIRDLRAKRVRPAVIRESLVAMQKQVAGMENPLIEASAFSLGSRVAYRHHGHSVEPTTGQFVLDFEPVGAVLSAKPVSSKLKPIANSESAAELFTRGIAMEEHPSTHDEAIRTYHQVLDIEPTHAAAHINLGTLYYNRRDFVSAEKHYRLAVAADPRYALAYFDLGNVLDETARVQEAVDAYSTALQLAPTYADAHYNIALAYERLGQPRRALRHWKAYLKLDSAGAWAQHAKNQVGRILAIDPLKLVYRRQS
jgi:tetratricopeptide (TPR) repeat protein